MERELGKDVEAGKKRIVFLMDNCDAVEEKGYMKHYTPEELAKLREVLDVFSLLVTSIGIRFPTVN